MENTAKDQHLYLENNAELKDLLATLTNKLKEARPSNIVPCQ
jgi:hypothetical protein